MMNKLENLSQKPWTRLLCVILLSFGRFLYCGFSYYPQLDDYIQYYNYEFGLAVSEYWQTVEKIGLLGARPLAGLGDLYVWSHFWNCMILAVLVISVLYALSAFLFEAAFRRFFRCGWIFLMVYTLMPINFEGTYWISASSRLVCGLFFTALSCYLLVRFSETGRGTIAFFSCLSQLIAFCYYEQILVLSFALNIIIGLLCMVKSRKPRGLLALNGVLSTVLYFAITGYLADGGIYSSRIKLALPKSDYYFEHFLPDIAGQVKSVLVDGTWLTLSRGFTRGLRMIFQDGALLYLLMTLLLCAAAGIMALYRDGDRKSRAIRAKTILPLVVQILVSLVLMAVPVVIFFFIANPWFSLRNALPSLLGFALLADGVISCLLALIPMAKIRQISTAALVFCFGFVCMTAAASEISDYQQTYHTDQLVAGLLLEEHYRGEINDEPVLIFNVKSSYLPEQNFLWHEHIHGVTESSWALRGILNSLGGSNAAQCVPLEMEDVLYRAWNYETVRPDRFVHFLYFHDDSGTLEKVYLHTLEEGYYEVRNAEDDPLFRIREKKKIGYLESNNSQ